MTIQAESDQSKFARQLKDPSFYWFMEDLNRLCTHLSSEKYADYNNYYITPDEPTQLQSDRKITIYVRHPDDEANTVAFLSRLHDLVYCNIILQPSDRHFGKRDWTFQAVCHMRLGSACEINRIKQQRIEVKFE